MEITEVRIFPKQSVDKKLKAYATITFDNAFVVRNIKVIEGNKGMFVAMPSRRLKKACHKCGHGNVFRSKFCNQCGAALEQTPVQPSMPGMPGMHENLDRQSEHRDIAHPITQDCREYIQKKVLDAYQHELAKGPQALGQ